VYYTVSAGTGTTAVYTVTVTVTSSTDNSSSAKAITGFSFADPAVEGSIDDNTKTISVTVPYGTNLYSLVPEITHTGVSISPASWEPQDFSYPVYYTVTAENGTMETYTVYVTVAGSNAKAITGFSFADLGAEGSIDDDTKTISVTVPSGTNLYGLVPTIAHTGADISPASWETQNFSYPVYYTVTAEDGTAETYIVYVTVAPSSAKAITGFSFWDLAAAVSIDEDAKTISVTVPYGTNLYSLVPTITHTGADISPASWETQDFSSPVQYTVTAENGTTEKYIVNVTVTLPGQGGITLAPLTDAASGELSGWPITIAKSVGTYNQTETLYIVGTFDTCKWRVDGTVKGTGNSFVLDAANYILGPHQLSLEVTLNGIPYSKSGTFTVVSY
jgi:hypothetical protein